MKRSNKNHSFSMLLQEILAEGKASTQQEIAQTLKANGLNINQSTISRTLRKIGAVKALDQRGRAIYRLPVAGFALGSSQAITDLVVGIDSNESLIMIHTRAGSASVVAQMVDEQKYPEILGTIAGDGEILVVPKSIKFKKNLLLKLGQLLDT